MKKIAIVTNQINYKVSIIVPIFNKEKYLSRCINSLINQTLSDIEIILINDGSWDKSREICEKYEQNDIRIKLINKINGGVSSARNMGLDIASGEFITFVDPDDYIESDAIEYLYNLINKYNVDIACYKMNTIKNNKKIFNKDEKEDIKIYLGKSIVENQVKNGNFLFSSCNKLYSNSLFNDGRCRFREDIRYAEDALFNMYLLNNAKRLVYSNLRKYNYFINEESTVTKINEKRIDVLKAQRIMYDFYLNEYSEYLYYIIRDYIGSSIAIVIDIAYNEKLLNSVCLLNKLKKQIKYDKYILKDIKHINMKKKIIFFILKNNPILLVILYKIRFFFLREKVRI